ncbi:hypothetical protein Tco_1409324 [Tanacetum coccineum]
MPNLNELPLIGSLQMDEDDEIFSLVDLHIYMLFGGWKWQDLLRLALVDHYGTFGKYLEEEHVTWAQFRKKRDKKATLQDFDGALDYSAWRRRHKSPLTPSKLEGYEVTIICDDVTIANLKKPIEDSAG